jgi:hypothetical protein
MFQVFYSKNMVKNTFCWISLNGQEICYCNILIPSKQPLGIYSISSTPSTALATMKALGYGFCPSEVNKFLQMMESNVLTQFDVVGY